MAARNKVSQVTDLSFKICQKWPKDALFRPVWMPKMFMEGSIFIGTNLDDEQRLLITV